MAGERPAHPVAWAKLEEAARQALEPERPPVRRAGTEDTMRANLEAFRRRRIVPRMLRDVAQRDLSTGVLGTAMPAPVMVAPVGVQWIVHPDGEPASARAAAALGVPCVASTASSFSLEEIAEGAGDAPGSSSPTCRSSKASASRTTWPTRSSTNGGN